MRLRQHAHLGGAREAVDGVGHELQGQLLPVGNGLGQPGRRRCHLALGLLAAAQQRAEDGGQDAAGLAAKVRGTAAVVPARVGRYRGGRHPGILQHQRRSTLGHAQAACQLPGGHLGALRGVAHVEGEHDGGVQRGKVERHHAVAVQARQRVQHHGARVAGVAQGHLVRHVHVQLGRVVRQEGEDANLLPPVDDAVQRHEGHLGHLHGVHPDVARRAQPPHEPRVLQAVGAHLRPALRVVPQAPHVVVAHRCLGGPEVRFGDVRQAVAALAVLGAPQLEQVRDDTPGQRHPAAREHVRGALARQRPGVHMQHGAPRQQVGQVEAVNVPARHEAGVLVPDELHQLLQHVRLAGGHVHLAPRRVVLVDLRQRGRRGAPGEEVARARGGLQQVVVHHHGHLDDGIHLGLWKAAVCLGQALHVKDKEPEGRPAAVLRVGRLRHGVIAQEGRAGEPGAGGDALARVEGLDPAEAPVVPALLLVVAARGPAADPVLVEGHRGVGGQQPAALHVALRGMRRAAQPGVAHPDGAEIGHYRTHGPAGSIAAVEGDGPARAGCHVRQHLHGGIYDLRQWRHSRCVLESPWSRPIVRW